MDPEKVKAISDWDRPTTMTELRAFLGMCNFLRRWFEHYAEQSKPLNDLLKKGKNIIKDWGPPQTQAFLTLKAAFIAQPILRMPNFSKPFILHTDACDHSLGGVLLQETQAHLLPVHYHSRGFNSAEMNYTVREQECLAMVDSFKKFEHYLRGSEFTVVMHTDHSSLTFLSNGSPLTGRLGRWREYLEGFDYQVVYIKGSHNVLGDALSRSLTLHTTQTTTTFNSPIESVESRTNSTYVNRVCALHRVHDNRMDKLVYDDANGEFEEAYKELGETDIITMDTGNPLYRYYARIGTKLYYRLPNDAFPLCIPKSATYNDKPLREVLINECHDSPSMGHRGYHRTYAQIRQLFYWPKMLGDVRRYINQCVECLRAKPHTHGERGRLKPNESPLRRMDSISMDFIVGLPKVKGLSNLLVIVERLSKKVFTRPYPETATALDVARDIYDNIFSEHGLPHEIISDRDAKFTGEIWRCFFKVLGTTLTMSYAYHQRFDGQTEVTNRTIEQIMRCYINFNQDNWLELLPNVTSAINNSVHPATALSPNQVYYGRTISRPVNLLTRAVSLPEDLQTFMQEIEDRATLASDYVRLAAVQFSSAHYNALPRVPIDPRFVVGAKVMLDAHHLYLPGHRKRPSSKLTSRRIGPFKISKKISDVSYEVEMPKPWQVHCTFHVRNLTFVPSDEFSTRASPEAEENQWGEDVWIVDRLDGMRKFYRRTQYYVIYQGYSLDDGMWQDRDSLLETCPTLVAKADLKWGYKGPKSTSRTPASVSAPRRRGRGRPRKEVAPPTDLVPRTDDLPKRGRGRPRKVHAATQ